MTFLQQKNVYGTQEGNKRTIQLSTFQYSAVVLLLGSGKQDKIHAYKVSEKIF